MWRGRGMIWSSDLTTAAVDLVAFWRLTVARTAAVSTLEYTTH